MTMVMTQANFLCKHVKLHIILFKHGTKTSLWQGLSLCHRSRHSSSSCPSSIVLLSEAPVLAAASIAPKECTASLAASGHAPGWPRAKPIATTAHGMTANCGLFEHIHGSKSYHPCKDVWSVHLHNQTWIIHKCIYKYKYNDSACTE